MAFEERTVEYKGKEQQELVGLATLNANVSKGWKEFTNDDDVTKRYKLVNIAFEAPNGQQVKMLAQLHEANIELAGGEDNFEKGEEYLTTIRLVESKKEEGKMIPMAMMSHLQGSIENVDAVVDMFSEMNVKADAEQPAVDA